MSRWPKASPNVLEDCVHVIRLYFLDNLLEAPCEVTNQIFFLFESRLYGANVSLLSHQVEIL